MCFVFVFVFLSTVTNRDEGEVAGHSLEPQDNERSCNLLPWCEACSNPKVWAMSGAFKAALPQHALGLHKGGHLADSIITRGVGIEPPPPTTTSEGRALEELDVRAGTIRREYYRPDQITPMIKLDYPTDLMLTRFSCAAGCILLFGSDVSGIIPLLSFLVDYSASKSPLSLMLSGIEFRR